MSQVSPGVAVSPAALFRHPPFLLFFTARAFSRFCYQIGAVAVGWQVYALTNSALDLGLIGLTQFVPMALLVFVAGHAADRFDRRRVAQMSQIVAAVTAAFLAYGSFAGWLEVPEIFAAVAVLGMTAAFESPTTAAMLPLVAPGGMLQRATAVSSATVQVATIIGPALGGLAYAVSPGVPYAIITVAWLIAAFVNGAITLAPQPARTEPPTLATLFAGVGFVRRNPLILGSISLDLFAVLLGGVTALMPIYARDILHTGPWGLGILRGAPAVGAMVMAAALARTSLTRRVGLRMFQAVIVFGVATVVFALSQWLWLSLIALAVLGAADMISVVIRLSLVQLATPDDMRGRVGAVNYLFINASAQLGEFESGIAAFLLGAVPAAVLGGLGTIAVALLWMKLFPSLRAVERLE
ncbi:MAG TPA: MFS transporter [Xanthobacteraceae bacterium]|jgi:MFS family permease|nr:MFS transporter [Xanthobacteraceae bacterium]